MKKVLLLACLAAIACGDDDVTMDGSVGDGGVDDATVIDSGPETDAGDDAGDMADAGDDAGDMADAGNDAGDIAGTVCGDAIAVAPTVGGEAITETVDLAAVTTTPIPLNADGTPPAEACGSTMADPAPNQVAIAVTVPGDDGVAAVTVSTDNAGTDFDTIIQLQGTTCGDISETTCFDDINFPDNPRSTASVVAEAGSVQYFIVSGFDANGTAEITVTAEAAAAPVLTGASVLHFIADEQLRYTISGSDANGNVAQFRTVLLDADGNEVVVDVDDDGTPDTSTFTFGLDEADGMETFTDITVPVGTGGIVPAEVTQTDLTLLDATGLESDTMRVAVTAATIVERGEACDATNVCREPNVCGDADVCVAPPGTPVITMAEGLRIGAEDFYARAVGTDSDMNTIGARLTWLDATDMVVEVGGETSLALRFDNDTTGATDVDGTIYLAGINVPAEATQLQVALLDEDDFESDPITVAIGMGTAAGLGDACSATAICAPPTFCNDSDVCAAPAEIVAACMDAGAITLTDNAGSAMGTIASGDGLFTGTCGRTPGLEGLHTVTVPDGAFDLLAASDGGDTVLYVMSPCESGTVIECNDDVASGMTNSALEIQDIAAGTYTVVVEDWGGIAEGETLDYTLDVRLRPVLAAGAACDMTGEANRCADGDCTGGTCPAP